MSVPVSGRQMEGTRVGPSGTVRIPKVQKGLEEERARGILLHQALQLASRLSLPLVILL